MNYKKIFFKNYLILILNLNLFSKCCYKNNELKNNKENDKKIEDILKKNKNNIELYNPLSKPRSKSFFIFYIIFFPFFQ